MSDCRDVMLLLSLARRTRLLNTYITASDVNKATTLKAKAKA